MYHYTLDGLEETRNLSSKIAKRLKKGGFLLLYGDLGVGKTTLTQSLAECLDIKEKIKSPTYTLMQNYKLPDGRDFYHLDLYRLNDADEIFVLGYEEIIANPENIVVIEWADRIGHEDKPKNRIDVFLSLKENYLRNVELSIVRQNRLNEEGIEELLDEYATPLNVRKHCDMVAQVALEIGARLIQTGEVLSQGFLYEAAMLHDMVRLIDFKDFKRENFEEMVTDEKWKIWNDLRKKYAGRHHAEVAQEILIEKGKPEIAEIVRKHCASAILQMNEKEENISWEDKILYYADKRVKHTNLVTLTERFALGRENLDLSGAELERSFLIESKAKELENDIFERIGENPETYFFVK